MRTIIDHKSLLIHLVGTAVDLAGPLTQGSVIIVDILQVCFLLVDHLQLLLDLALAEGACQRQGVLRLIVGVINFIDLLLDCLLLFAYPLLCLLQILLQHCRTSLLDLCADFLSHLLELLIQVCVFRSSFFFKEVMVEVFELANTLFEGG